VETGVGGGELLVVFERGGEFWVFWFGFFLGVCGGGGGGVVFAFELLFSPQTFVEKLEKRQTLETGIAQESAEDSGGGKQKHFLSYTFPFSWKTFGGEWGEEPARVTSLQIPGQVGRVEDCSQSELTARKKEATKITKSI